MYVDDKGILAGVEPDFAQAVSEVMGVKFNNVAVGSFSDLLPGLQSGRYDVSFSDFGVTAERLAAVDMIPHFSLSTSFGVKKGTGNKITAGTNLCGLTLGAISGSYFLTQAQALSKTCTDSGAKEITIQNFPTSSAAILALGTGRIDVYAASTAQVAYAATQSASLAVQPFQFSPLPQAVALPKGSQLAKAIQAALRELISNGTYSAILKKWGIPTAAIPASEILINPTP